MTKKKPLSVFFLDMQIQFYYTVNLHMITKNFIKKKFWLEIKGWTEKNMYITTTSPATSSPSALTMTIFPERSENKKYV